jgi:hypothetical protein
VNDPSANNLDQSELDDLLRINGFLADEKGRDGKSLIEEIQEAILDSGKLSLAQWQALRDRLSELEKLAPTIDLIIRLKQRRGG